MRGSELLIMIGNAAPAYIEEAEIVPRKKSAWKRRASVAACVCGFFILATTTVFAMNVGGIREWFAYTWEQITGNSMSHEHTAVIDHLSQDIGISQTVDDVTVTVDSATAGRDSFYLLIRIDGIDLKKSQNYGFHDIQLNLSPDPVTEMAALAGYEMEYLGSDENWNSVFLLSYDFSGTGYLDSMAPSVRVELSLNDIVQDSHTEWEKTVKNAEWSFSFILDYQKAFETMKLPDLALVDDVSQKTVNLSDIELTNTGLHIRCSSSTLHVSQFPTYEIVAVMKNGATIYPRSGVGTSDEDGTAMLMTYIWRIPLNLCEIDHLVIDGTKIELHA